MPSRNPASDDFEDFGLPDLPSDLFGDDEALYEPRHQRAPRQQRDQEEWEDARPEPRERTRRTRRHDEDALFDERPRRLDDERKTRHRQRPADDDSYSVRTRADSRLEYVSGVVERPLQAPPRRRREQPDGNQRRRQRQPHAPSRHDRVVERPRMQAEAATMDVLTGMRPVRAERPARQARHRNPAWSWKPIVMPQPWQMLEQAFPNLLMAISAVSILFLMPYLPFGLPLWAPLVLVPMLALFHFSNKKIHPMWARAALVNLATVGAFFPFVIMRQSVLRVPFVEFGNGTLTMPILATVGVVVLLAALAMGSALLCEEDPEYAGIVFLPAALLVPFFAGATEITSLPTAIIVLASIYFVSAILTVVASMLPGAYPTLVAPVALAFEFLVLQMAGSTPIFPAGAGMSAKLLFFIVLLVAVGLTIAVPMLAVWTRLVRRFVQAGGSAGRAAMGTL